MLRTRRRYCGEDALTLLPGKSAWWKTLSHVATLENRIFVALAALEVSPGLPPLHISKAVSGNLTGCGKKTVSRSVVNQLLGRVTMARFRHSRHGRLLRSGSS
jgi:hypothetical protein